MLEVDNPNRSRLTLLRYSHRASVLLIISAIFLQHCTSTDTKATNNPAAFKPGQFGYDVAFFREHHDDALVLEKGEAHVIVLPAYQGRVMTSTAAGTAGKSYGWINYDLIKGGKLKEHMNAFGGEDRFWLGPEGGQFSIYFSKGVPFTFDNWFVPKELDTEPFVLKSSSPSSALFEKEIRLPNYAGHEFQLKVNRKIQLLSRDSIASALGSDVPADLKVVGFQSENVITNTGSKAWTKETGALSIWILGMFTASDSARVAIPYRVGDEKQLGKIVTDDYFGPIPPERLKIKNGFVVLRADGKFRSKLGISPARAMPWICSYDPSNGLLTIVQFTLNSHDAEYVNSQWKIQDEPFKGDAANAYNDGPLPNGDRLGNFYEMESSSPAAFLDAGESILHVQRTMHFEGSRDALDTLCRKVTQLSLSDISL